jgi:hypothetical protein
VLCKLQSRKSICKQCLRRRLLKLTEHASFNKIETRAIFLDKNNDFRRLYAVKDLTALNAAVPKIYIPAYMKIEAINEY